MADVRSFVAVPLPEELQRRVFAAAQELARAPGLHEVRWTRKIENLHVTVKFLDQVSEDRLGALGAALAASLAPVPSFRLRMHRMGAFRSARHASVLWAWADDVDRGLAAVVEAVEATAERLGFARERRPFTGHVTVGRAKRGGVDARAALDAFADRDFGAATITEVHLYESRLGGGPQNSGSTYILRSRAALSGAAAFN